MGLILPALSPNSGIYWEAVEFVAKNVKTNKQDNLGNNSVLLEAVAKNRLETVRLLIKARALPNEACLRKAIENKNLRMIALLLANRANPNSSKVMKKLGEFASSKGEDHYNIYNKAVGLAGELVSLPLKSQTIWQAAKDPENPFHALGKDMVNHIMGFVNEGTDLFSYEQEKQKNDNIKSYFPQIRSCQSFLKVYNSGFFHIRSSDSKDFAKKMAAILEDKNSSLEKKASHSKELINTFLSHRLNENAFVQSRAIRSLKENHLIDEKTIESGTKKDTFRLGLIIG